MPETLIACALNVESASRKEALARKLRSPSQPPQLVLNTCQRLEVFGRTRPEAQDNEAEDTALRREALLRLTRIAAGLESRILGELEIMGQVREAYKCFSEHHAKSDPSLNRLFQDSIALARKARRESGIDQNLTGLAALAARRVMDSVPEDATVCIVGSGSLAKGVARYLGKRSELPLHISSRCPENAAELAQEVDAFSSGMDELAHNLASARVVVTATAAPHPILYAAHLPESDQARLIIDLGEPPDCEEALRNRNDVDYVGLLDIEEMAQTNTDERKRRAQVAEQIIRDAVLSE